MHAGCAEKQAKRLTVKTHLTLVRQATDSLWLCEDDPDCEICGSPFTYDRNLCLVSH
jgi:hypothetical protein